MTLLILEMLLALGVIIGIMVWTLKTRTDTPLDVTQDTVDSGGSADTSDAEGTSARADAATDVHSATQANQNKPTSDSGA